MSINTRNKISAALGFARTFAAALAVCAVISSCEIFHADNPSQIGSITMRLPSAEQMSAASGGAISGAVTSYGILGDSSVASFKVRAKNAVTGLETSQITQPGSIIKISPLEPGFWNVTVFGNNSDGQTIYYGNSANILVAAGKTTPASVVINPVNSSTPLVATLAETPAGVSLQGQGRENVMGVYLSYSSGGQSGSAYYDFSNAAGSAKQGDDLNKITVPIPAFLEPGSAVSGKVYLFDRGGTALWGGSIEGSVKKDGTFDCAFAFLETALKGYQGSPARTFLKVEEALPAQLETPLAYTFETMAYGAPAGESKSYSDLTIFSVAPSEACGKIPVIVECGSSAWAEVFDAKHKYAEPTVTMPEQKIPLGATRTLSAVVSSSEQKEYSVFRAAQDFDAYGFKLYSIQAKDTGSTVSASSYAAPANPVSSEFTAPDKVKATGSGSDDYTWQVTVTNSAYSYFDGNEAQPSQTFSGTFNVSGSEWTITPASVTVERGAAFALTLSCADATEADAKSVTTVTLKMNTPKDFVPTVSGTSLVVNAESFATWTSADPKKVFVYVESVDAGMIEVTATAPSGGGGGGNAAVNENFVQSQKKFSVGAGMQVYFSQGNLQYQASTDTWRFAEHQYDVVPEEDLAFTKVTSDYDEWIDVFGWGSSGYGRAKPYTRDYSETDESGKSILTSLNVYGAIGVNIDYDWGVYNPIANGGNKKGLWYTLTDAEWTYLLNTRTNASSLRAPATITDTTTSPAKSVAGLVVLPDDWTAPSDISFTIPVTTTGDAGWAVNVFTLEEWEKMECSGAVFLPALGMQDSSGSFSNRSSNFRVYYWSSSCYSSNDNTKYCIEYDGPTGSPYRYSPSANNFMPVRLVKSSVDISPNIYISPNAGSGGDGSAASPYASIADAIAQIKTNSSRTTDYTIYIDGALTGKQEIKDITPDCVKSITIKGKNGIDPATGEPRDSLAGDGAASSGPLLTIATNVVVKVEDLKITGGYAEQGGGVYVGNGSIACYVTLGSGALITGNKADTKGAGVYATNGDGTYLTIDGAVIKNNELVSDTAGSRLGSAVYSIGKQLVIKGDSLITNNLGSNEDNACPAVCVDWYQYRTSGYDISKFPESSIEGNAQIVNNTGVGVKAYVCNLSIKGNAKISGNTNAMSNSQGGGMIVEGYTRSYSYTYTAKVTISENAQISGNFADNGAGVFVKNNDTTLKIEGGSINGNKAQKLGGGVYCYGATIEISGGSIESNQVLADSTTTEGGGGVYLESWDNTSAGTSNKAAIYLSGGTIKSNTCAGGLGTGIFANDFLTSSSNEYMVKIQDAGKVDLNNDIYLMRTTYLNPVIRIVNDLTETGTLAKVSLEKYENGNEVLGKGYYDPWTYINNHYSQFEIANSAWTLNSSGKLVSN